MSMESQKVEFEFIVTSYNVSQLEGEVLTLIDASVSDPVQRKAQKDLFKNMIWNWVYRTNPPVKGSVGSASKTEIIQ